MITKEISLFLLQWRNPNNPSELKTNPSFESSSVINMYELVQNFAKDKCPNHPHHPW